MLFNKILFRISFIPYFPKLSYGLRFRFLLCLIDMYSKYSWVIPLEDKKGNTKKKNTKKKKYKKFKKNLIVNQINYGLTKAASFTIDQ